MRPTEQMRDRCHQLILDLKLYPWFNSDDLIHAARRLYRRPITVHDLPPGRGGLTGLLLADDRRAQIWVVPDTAGFHIRHIVAHELAHLLLGHPGTPTTAGGQSPGKDALCLSEPGQVRDDPHEVEAELFATMLYTEPIPMPEPPPIEQQRRDVRWRQEEAFGRPHSPLT